MWLIWLQSVDLIHVTITCAASLQEKNGLKRGEDGLKAEFFHGTHGCKRPTVIICFTWRQHIVCFIQLSCKNNGTATMGQIIWWWGDIYLISLNKICPFDSADTQVIPWWVMENQKWSQVNMMAELPSNVFLAEEFLEYFASWQYQLVPRFVCMSRILLRYI